MVLSIFLRFFFFWSSHTIRSYGFHMYIKQTTVKYGVMLSEFDFSVLPDAIERILTDVKERP